MLSSRERERIRAYAERRRQELGLPPRARTVPLDPKQREAARRLKEYVRDMPTRQKMSDEQVREAHQMYMKSELTWANIGDLYGVSGSAVNYRVKALGLPTSRNQQADEPAPIESTAEKAPAAVAGSGLLAVAGQGEQALAAAVDQVPALQRVLRFLEALEELDVYVETRIQVMVNLDVRASVNGGGDHGRVG